MGTGTLNLESASEILAAAKISATPLALTPLTGGANNRVFRLDLEHAPSLILKSYFQHPQDLRPRLKSEFEFLSFAWAEGIRCIPKPLYQDPTQNLALYTHINAPLATSDHSTLSFIEAAADFLLDLNRKKHSGKHLSYASEACLKISDYFEAVEKRLYQLLCVSQETLVEKQLHQFLQHQLLPQWNQIKETTCKTALQALSPDPSDLILSPSDFGLHNVLVSTTNHYTFIDFEYAGWDDPVKTICDFFLQPRVPISCAYFEYFSKLTVSLTPNPQKTLERTKLLFPICKIKWCCMILNVFLHTGKARREFANVDLSAAQAQQLVLAQSYLSDYDRFRRKRFPVLEIADDRI